MSITQDVKKVLISTEELEKRIYQLGKQIEKD